MSTLDLSNSLNRFQYVDINQFEIQVRELVTLNHNDINQSLRNSKIKRVNIIISITSTGGSMR